MTKCPSVVHWEKRKWKNVTLATSTTGWNGKSRWSAEALGADQLGLTRVRPHPSWSP